MADAFKIPIVEDEHLAAERRAKAMAAIEAEFG